MIPYLRIKYEKMIYETGRVKLPLTKAPTWDQHHVETGHLRRNIVHFILQ